MVKNMMMNVMVKVGDWAKQQRWQVRNKFVDKGDTYIMHYGEQNVKVPVASFESIFIPKMQPGLKYGSQEYQK
jgi:hypothetical protein